MASVGAVSLPTQCLVPPHNSVAAEPHSKHHLVHHCSLIAPRLRPQIPANCSFSNNLVGLSSCKHLAPSLDVYHQAVAAPFGLRWDVVADLCGVSDDNAINTNDQNNEEASRAAHAMAPVMKREYGAFGGATLEKSKLDLSQSKTSVSPKTEDGGGGGDIGNKINFGGGDGGDDDGDDDDYIGDGDDDDDGDEGGFFRRRISLPEIFDRKIVEAVLMEWYRTISDLPAGLRQAVELGFISSAQMARFISSIGRPTMARFISRAVPPTISRQFVGRMIADPGFLYKMCWEQAVTIAYGVWWEIKHRKERLKDEWDLAAINILTLSLCNAAIVWSLAPCRSYGSTFKFNLQNTIQKLPNNVFERSYAFREFDMAKRVQSFLYKAGELCLVGMLTGAAGGGLLKLAASRKENASMPTPGVRTSALSYGAFLGLSGNLRYQLLYGAERLMQEHFEHLAVAIFCSGTFRVLNIYIGDATRLAWLGLDVVSELKNESFQSAYHRPSFATEGRSGGWSFSKIFPLSFLDRLKDLSNKQSSSRAPARRKVRRKVMTSS